MGQLLRHVWIAALGLVVLPVFGVPWQTALYVGVVTGCVLMAFDGGHRARAHKSLCRSATPAMAAGEAENP